ncbi:MAG: hypothetical protein ACKOJF_36300, partial [Planctomycetaceae bacterium]
MNRIVQNCRELVKQAGMIRWGWRWRPEVRHGRRGALTRKEPIQKVLRRKSGWWSQLAAVGRCPVR